MTDEEIAIKKAEEIKNRVAEYSKGDPGIEIDSEYVVCPYCGSQSGDCWEWVKQEPNEMHCHDCGGHFEYWAEYAVDYWSKPVKGSSDGPAKDTGESQSG